MNVRIALSTVALCSLATAALAQTAPLPLAGVQYQYWPMQMVQFVGPELPYSMILLYVDDREKAPRYDASLIDRASGKRVHYANVPALVAEDKAKGDDAYLVQMAFDQPASPGKEAQYLLRFNTEKGVPVSWQFVQGTDISEQGSGLSPVDAPFPVLLYREQGALAGEGTALRVGAVTSTADVWKEYAQPPYFIPYHGAISTGVHILSFAPTHVTWTGAEPTTLSGANWQITSQYGTAYAGHADAGRGNTMEVTFSSKDHGTVQTLEGTPGTSFSAASVRLGPADAKPGHTLTLIFTPSLSNGVSSHFELVAGRKTGVASGSVVTATESGATTETWSLASPDSVKGKSSAGTAAAQ